MQIFNIFNGLIKGFTDTVNVREVVTYSQGLRGVGTTANLDRQESR